MVHTLVQHPRMQAGLHLHEPPSVARIVALSGMLALHAVALMLLLMPMAVPVPAPVSESAVFEFQEIPRRKPVVVPVEAPQPERRAPVVPQRPAAQPRPDVPPVDAPVVVESGEQASLEPSTDTAVDEIDVPATGPVAAMRLEYAQAPAPDYPRDAQRRRLQGVVMLQVLVDVDGRPLEVLVQQSSGHRQLDAIARRQVLERWRFRPATRDGVPVQAIGLVPVEFRLR